MYDAEKRFGKVYPWSPKLSNGVFCESRLKKGLQDRWGKKGKKKKGDEVDVQGVGGGGGQNRGGGLKSSFEKD